MASRRAYRFAFFARLLVVLAAGCGVSEYQKRMDQERARMKVFDEENKYLGEVLEPPFQKKKDGPEVMALPFDLFLRLPQGITGTPTEKGVYSFPSGINLYRYSGTRKGYSVILAAAPVGIQDKNTKLKAGEWTHEGFRDIVQKGMQTVFGKPIPAPPKLKKHQEQPHSSKGQAVPPLEFDFFTHEEDPNVKDASYYAVYFHHKGSRQLALIYQVPLKAITDTRSAEAPLTAINMSLRTLDIAGDAGEQRRKFKKYKRID